MSVVAPSRSFAPAVGRFSGPQRTTFMQAFDVTRDTLRAWRARARERAELAVMDARERRDLPHARDFDLRGEADKPFWRD